MPTTNSNCFKPPFSPCETDVYSYANFASFPWAGELDKLYIDIATGSTYYWDGSGFQTTSATPTADIYVNNGSFNATTSELTLNDTDAGTPDVVIDMTPNVANDLWIGANGIETGFPMYRDTITNSAGFTREFNNNVHFNIGDNLTNTGNNALVVWSTNTNSGNNSGIFWDRNDNTGVDTIGSGVLNDSTLVRGFFTGQSNTIGGRWNNIWGLGNTSSATVDSSVLYGDGNTNTWGDNTIIAWVDNQHTGWSNTLVLWGTNISTANNSGVLWVSNTAGGSNNMFIGDSNSATWLNNYVWGIQNVLNGGSHNAVIGLRNQLNVAPSVLGNYNFIGGIDNVWNTDSSLIIGQDNSWNDVRLIIGGRGNTIIAGHNDSAITAGLNITSVREETTHTTHLWVDAVAQGRIYTNDAAAGVWGLVQGEVYASADGAGWYDLKIKA